MKFGDRVLYSEAGKTWTVTVVGIHEADGHFGANGEPLLDLAWFAPVLDVRGNEVRVVGTGQQNELVQWRHDVAHVSHAFEAAFFERSKQTPITNYPGGRWMEVSPNPTPIMLASEAQKPAPVDDDPNPEDGSKETVQ